MLSYNNVWVREWSQLCNWIKAISPRIRSSDSLAMSHRNSRTGFGSANMEIIAKSPEFACLQWCIHHLVKSFITSVQCTPLHAFLLGWEGRGACEGGWTLNTPVPTYAQRQMMIIQCGWHNSDQIAAKLSKSSCADVHHELQLCLIFIELDRAWVGLSLSICEEGENGRIISVLQYICRYVMHDWNFLFGRINITFSTKPKSTRSALHLLAHTITINHVN